jgi:hypothetical protein
MEMSTGETTIVTALVLTMVGGVVIGLPIFLALRYAHRQRELQHAERIRALELGMSLPQDEPWWTPARLCAGIGVGVPISVFLLAFVAALANGSQHDEPIWAAAGGIGALGVMCGAKLAGRLPLTKDQSNQRVDLGSMIKEEHEADAYDVVSRRG